MLCLPRATLQVVAGLPLQAIFARAEAASPRRIADHPRFDFGRHISAFRVGRSVPLYCYVSVSAALPALGSLLPNHPGGPESQGTANTAAARAPGGITLHRLRLEKACPISKCSQRSVIGSCNLYRHDTSISQRDRLSHNRLQCQRLQLIMLPAR